MNSEDEGAIHVMARCLQKILAAPSRVIAGLPFHSVSNLEMHQIEMLISWLETVQITLADSTLHKFAEYARLNVLPDLDLNKRFAIRSRDRTQALV